MITFTELLERAESEKIAIHTPNEEQAITLLTELNKMGYVWAGGKKLTATTRYEDYEENTCYVFVMDVDENLLNKKVAYGPWNFYQEEGYTIIEFSEIDFAEKPTKTTPKSDKGSIYTAVAYAITKKTYGSNKVFAEIVDEKLYKEKK